MDEPGGGAFTPIDCPSCHAGTLDVSTGLRERGALTFTLIPPVYHCPKCLQGWMLGEVGEPGAIAVPEGLVLVPVKDDAERRT
jgi:hypothetical protein